MLKVFVLFHTLPVSVGLAAYLPGMLADPALDTVNAAILPAGCSFRIFETSEGYQHGRQVAGLASPEGGPAVLVLRQGGLEGLVELDLFLLGEQRTVESVSHQFTAGVRASPVPIFTDDIMTDFRCIVEPAGRTPRAAGGRIAAAGHHDRIELTGRNTHAGRSLHRACPSPGNLIRRASVFGGDGLVEGELAALPRGKRPKQVWRGGSLPDTGSIGAVPGEIGDDEIGVPFAGGPVVVLPGKLAVR